MKEKLVYYSYKYEGDWFKIAKAIKNKEKVEEVKIIDNYITILDKEYPQCLRQLKFPPWVIYYIGDISLLKKDCISVVGSREASEYGIYVTSKVVENNKDKIIVSGLAKGIDTIAHLHAIKYTKTIGVIASGLDTIYPSCNDYLYYELSKNHLIISEYPHFTKIKKYNFPFRNRIIAALGQSLYVTQARYKSGTMHTVNEALELAKDIYCPPYNITDKNGEGCNLLISQGANIIIDL